MSSIRTTVIDIQADFVSLALEDGQRLRVPLTVCEGSVQVGTEVRLQVISLSSEDAGRTRLARELVNEILRV